MSWGCAGCVLFCCAQVATVCQQFAAQPERNLCQFSIFCTKWQLDSCFLQKAETCRRMHRMEAYQLLATQSDDLSVICYTKLKRSLVSYLLHKATTCQLFATRSWSEDSSVICYTKRRLVIYLLHEAKTCQLFATQSKDLSVICCIKWSLPVICCAEWKLVVCCTKWKLSLLFATQFENFSVICLSPDINP